MRWGSRKASGTQAVFTVSIHSLGPWPALHGPLIVEYQRGSKKRGYSGASEPIDVETGVTRYEWSGSSGASDRDRFVIDATLYAGKDGLEQKLLNIYVCQVDEKGKPGNMVGGVVLDLAKLVGLPEDTTVRQEYSVECSQSIVEMAGGRPKLVIGLRRGVPRGDQGGRNKQEKPKEVLPALVVGVKGDDGRDDRNDAGNSDLPSRLSTEVPSSERQMDAMEESVTTVMSPTRVEVATRGFKADNGDQVNAGANMVVNGYDEDGFIVDEDDEDDEDDDEDEEDEAAVEDAVQEADADKCVKEDHEPTVPQREAPVPQSPTTTKKNLEEEFRRASLDDGDLDNGGANEADNGVDVSEDINNIIEKEESVVPPLPPPDLSPFQASKQKPVHARRFSRDVNTSFGSMRQAKGERERGTGSRSGHETPLDSPSVASCGSAMKESGVKDGIDGKNQYRRELEVLAALEAAVWCAGYVNLNWHRNTEATGDGIKLPSKNSKSRMNRKSPKSSSPHLTAARRLARTVIALGDLDGAEFAERAIKTIKIACASSLGDVHRFVLWWSALITLRIRFFTLAEDAGDGKAGSGSSSFFGWLTSVAPIIADAEAEIYANIVQHIWDAHVAPNLMISGDVDSRISRIMFGLNAALDALSAFSDTSVSILKTLNRLVLEDIAVKLDVALLQGHLALASSSSSSSNRVDGDIVIDSSTGLEIKMLVSKLTTYFNSRGAFVEATPGPTPVMLPRMDSLSNVLVSQKAGLADAEVRKAIAPRISLATIITILSGYTMLPDEGSIEDFQKLLTTLKTKASTTVDLNATYEVLDDVEYTPPDEHTLVQQGIVQSLRLEMSEDSEEEIDDVLGGERKGHLWELWGL